MTWYTVKTQLENLESILTQAQENHDDMTELAYYDNYIQCKRHYLTMYISSLSSGTIAGIIGTGYYKNINYAINNTITYIYSTDDENITQIDRENINELYKLILECYRHDSYIREEV